MHIADNLPRIDGVTALYPLYSAFAKAVYPASYDEDDTNLGDAEVEPGTIVPQKVDNIIACTNTDGAYRRLIAGEADIIFVAGPSEGQLQMATGFAAFPYTKLLGDYYAFKYDSDR